MSMVKSLKILSLLLCLNFTGCATFYDPYFESGAVGGLVGAGVGAGGGALVGSAIANGDVAMSALLGGAVGLPLGILAGVAYRSHQEKSELEKNDEIIRTNYEYIMARQMEIDRLHEALTEDSFRILPNKELRSEIYTGSTIGTYNR